MIKLWWNLHPHLNEEAISHFMKVKNKKSNMKYGWIISKWSVKFVNSNLTVIYSVLLSLTHEATYITC